MGRTDGDEDAGLADLEAAKAMGDGDAIDGEFFVELCGDFPHFGESHGVVGFVVEEKRGAAVGLVADAAIESDDGAIGGSANMANEGRGINGILAEEDQVEILRVGHAEASAAANGRKESDFVAREEQDIEGRKLAVAGSDHGGAITGKLGMAGTVQSK